MAALVGLVVALVVTPIAGRVAVALGVMDRPGPLKVHVRAVPYLGGLGVLAAVVAGGGPAWAAMIGPAIAATALGVVDDVRDVPPSVRLASELAIGVWVALVIPVDLPAVIGPIAVALAVVALTNAVNLLDGLDGLAGGVSLVSALGFAVVLDGPPRTAALALAGGLAGFLVFNRPPARIYLGDGGSYLLGTMLAALLASAWQQGASASSSIAAVPLVAVPLADTAIVLVRRIRSSQPLFQGDRGHVYDQLVDRGFTPVRSTATLIALQTALAACALAAAQLSPASAGALVGAAGLALVVAARAGKFVAPRQSEATA